jgi:hypothetical protein
LKRTGIIILIIGLLLTLYTCLDYFEEAPIDMKKLEMEQDNRYDVNWQLLAGIGIMVVGGVVLVLGVNRKDEEKIFDK